jgi:hypothetical protein
MRADLITQKVPNADPDFLRIVEKLSDPPPGSFERVMEALPKLYALFVEKREAARKNDRDVFMAIVEKEVALIREVEGT